MKKYWQITIKFKEKDALKALMKCLTEALIQPKSTDFGTRQITYVQKLVKNSEGRPCKSEHRKHGDYNEGHTRIKRRNIERINAV